MRIRDLQGSEANLKRSSTFFHSGAIEKCCVIASLSSREARDMLAEEVDAQRHRE